MQASESAARTAIQDWSEGSYELAAVEGGLAGVARLARNRCPEAPPIDELTRRFLITAAEPRGPYVLRIDDLKGSVDSRLDQIASAVRAKTRWAGLAPLFAEGNFVRWIAYAPMAAVLLSIERGTHDAVARGQMAQRLHSELEGLRFARQYRREMRHRSLGATGELRNFTVVLRREAWVAATGDAPTRTGRQPELSLEASQHLFVAASALGLDPTNRSLFLPPPPFVLRELLAMARADLTSRDVGSFPARCALAAIEEVALRSNKVDVGLDIIGAARNLPPVAVEALTRSKRSLLRTAAAARRQGLTDHAILSIDARVQLAIATAALATLPARGRPADRGLEVAREHVEQALGNVSDKKREVAIWQALRLYAIAGWRRPAA